MKKNYILLLLLCLCFAGCKEKLVVESDHLPIADPYVMLYEGKYYAYGTGGTVEGEGFACFSSDDLKTGRVRAGTVGCQFLRYVGILGTGGVLYQV